MKTSNGLTPSLTVDKNLITKVKKAPRSNHVIKCNTKWQPFLEKISKKNTWEAFRSNIPGELKAAFDIVRRHPCLTSDFQLLIDSEGKVYHIDLDRCLGGIVSKPISWFE